MTDQPSHDHTGRRGRLRAMLVASDVDAALVTSPADVRYLTGFTGSNGTLLVPVEGDDVLLTDARYRERVGGLDIARVLVQGGLTEALAATGAIPARLAVDAEHLTLGRAERLRVALAGGALVAGPSLVMPLRACKDEAELARLELACSLTTAALTWLAEEVVAPGVTERAVARALEQRLLDLGADGVAFPTVVAAGPNGASPHHETSDRPVQPGELVTVDCGAEVDGYRADMTRTFGVGPVPAWLRDLHALVEAANLAGRRAVVPGGPVAAVDRAARAVIDAAGHGSAFVHPTGHGIGLDVHEHPLVSGSATASLQSGTTLTVEPGVYLAGLGGVRIEDSLAVRAGGAEVMTRMDRGLAA